MKKYIIRIFTIVVCLSITFVNVAMADGATPPTFSDADAFVQAGAGNPAINDLTEIGNQFTAVGKILRYIGAGIMVGAMGYMGILYMISPPERQAKLKQQLIGLVVAGFVIFGGYYIWKVVVQLFQGIEGS